LGENDDGQNSSDHSSGDRTGDAGSSADYGSRRPGRHDGNGVVLDHGIRLFEHGHGFNARHESGIIVFHSWRDVHDRNPDRLHDGHGRLDGDGKQYLWRCALKRPREKASQVGWQSWDRVHLRNVIEPVDERIVLDVAFRQLDLD
jgi:hypothetical protein